MKTILYELRNMAIEITGDPQYQGVYTISRNTDDDSIHITILWPNGFEEKLTLKQFQIGHPQLAEILLSMFVLHSSMPNFQKTTD